MSESHNLVIYVVSWAVSDPIGSTDLEGIFSSSQHIGQKTK